MIQSENRERFERLAEKRTQAIIEKLDILANCANERRYEYRDEDIEKIFDAIEIKLRETRSKFNTEESEEFSL
jgi:uncharacterized membrane protein